MRLLTTLRLLPAAIRLLVRDGPYAVLREIVLRLAARVRYGIPITSPSHFLELNVDYQRWWPAKAPSAEELETLRAEADVLGYTPLISVLMPAYNTAEHLLSAAVDSVIAQTYPRWELCIADDASPDAHVGPMLERIAARDGRIRIRRLERNGGIAAASNAALEMARGEFVALLDHDDELTPDALSEVVRHLNENRDCDLVYTDEDKRAPTGRLVDPFFKPSWSPDLLRSMNYITHLSVMRTDVVREVGGFRSECDGSQDYDLLLRVSERSGRVGHVARILYHWRMIPASASASPLAKPYAYEAAERAVRESIERSGEPGSVRMETPGRYRVRYRTAGDGHVAVVAFGEPVARARAETAHWSELSVSSDEPSGAARFVVFLEEGIVPASPGWVAALAEHAQRSSVGAVGAAVLDPDGTISESGVVVGDDEVRPAFAGWRPGVGTYFGVTDAVRNASAVSGLVMVRGDVLDQAGGIDRTLGPHARLVDLCLKIRRAGLEVVCTPYVRATCDAGEWIRPEDLDELRRRWPDALKRRDPYLNPNLVMGPRGMRLPLP